MLRLTVRDLDQHLQFLWWFFCNITKNCEYLVKVEEGTTRIEHVVVPSTLQTGAATVVNTPFSKSWYKSVNRIFLVTIYVLLFQRTRMGNFYILFFVHCTVAPFKVLSCFDTIAFFLNVLSYFFMFPSLLLFSVILALSLIAWLLRPPPCLTKWIITIITIHIIITITIIICIVKTVSKTMTMTLYLISILPCKLYICIYRFVFDIYWV